MAQLTIRPSTKLIRPWYWLSVILVILVFAFVQLSHSAQAARGRWLWLLLIPALMILATAVRHMGVSFTRMSLAGDSIRFETGVFAKSTRNIPISKIQDVRVEQSLGQRLFGLGDLSIETAGGASHITIVNVDGPQALADRILALVNPQAG